MRFQASDEEHSPHPGCKLGTVDGTFFLCCSGLLCPDPFLKFHPATGTHGIRNAFQMKSAMQQIVIFDADLGILEMSFKAFSYSSLPSFQLKVNKGLKEISLIGSSFSFLERQAMLLPSSLHFFAFLFSAVWCNPLL